MTVPITVVIPTYNRPADLSITLDKILACTPAPSEIIVHIDGNDLETVAIIEKQYKNIKLLVSNQNIGPGGGRNEGVKIATNELIASFDDDSYPIDNDYFQRLFDMFQKYQNAALIESAIYHKNEEIGNEEGVIFRSYLFTGCGAAYRKSAFLEIGGYVPIAIAYAMEESDFSLRAFEKKYLFLQAKRLRVFHNTILQHHTSSKINAAALTNTALLAFLRYPYSLWPYGAIQVLNRLVWSIKNKRFEGIFSGLYRIPQTCLRFKEYRHVLKRMSIKEYLLKRTSKEII